MSCRGLSARQCCGTALRATVVRWPLQQRVAATAVRLSLQQCASTVYSITLAVTAMYWPEIRVRVIFSLSVSCRSADGGRTQREGETRYALIATLARVGMLRYGAAPTRLLT